MRGDRQMLDELITNLMDNAVKYNRPGGRVDVSLSVQDGLVCLRVADTGIGIPKEHQEDVYKRQRPAYRVLKPAIELLAGIPSIVYGFFGLVVLVPFIRKFARLFGVISNGNTILTASILLGIMILPTIVGVSESAIRAVPDSYYEGALALGATPVSYTHLEKGQYGQAAGHRL